MRASERPDCRVALIIPCYGIDNTAEVCYTIVGYLLGLCEEADMRVNVDRGGTPSAMVMPLANKMFVSETLKCPRCGEARKKCIVWVSMDKVRCAACGHKYCVWINRAD